MTALNGWAGSGGNPWQLDEGTESIQFLTNMGNREVRIGYVASAGGVNYYLTDLKLKPHETRAIDIRKLRDAQQRDSQGSVLPAGATDGSVLWIRLDNVPVMGRVAVIKRQGGVASNYDCCICQCPAAYNSTDVTAATPYIIVGGTDQMAAWEWFTDCNWSTYSYNGVNNLYWASNAQYVATVSNSPRGRATGVGGGVALISGANASYFECYAYIPYAGCYCNEPVSPEGDGPVGVVAISGPQTVWWFNGQTPSGYTTTITLTALPSGASSYTWAFSQGGNKATFSGQSGNTINLTGTGLSVAPGGDVKVKVTVNGVTSPDYAITVRGPKTLVAGATNDGANSTYGYDSWLNYTIKDNLSQLLPSSIPLNEKWTSPVTNDYSNANWRRLAAAGLTTPDSTFADHIGGEAINLPAYPVPTSPQSPLSSTTVQHWGQEWRVGSTTSGAGARVQTDNIQKYLDHARHTNIVSPAP